MKDEDKPIFDKLTDAQAFGETIYLEARNQGFDGMLAVGSVIKHRADLGYFGGKSVKAVCHKQGKPKTGKYKGINVCQFSCYNEFDEQYPIALRIAKDFQGEMENNTLLKTAYTIAEHLMSGAIQPNVYASFYKVHGCPAAWEKNMVHVVKIKDHDFYREPGDHMA